MHRLPSSAVRLATALAALITMASVTLAHDGIDASHHHAWPTARNFAHLRYSVQGDGALAKQPAAAPSGEVATTGKGQFRFKLRPITLPEPVAKQLVQAHGGFAPDPEYLGGTGKTYFSLKGVGLLALDPDLTKIDIIGGDSAFANVNLHNTCLFRDHGVTYLALPSDQAQRVFLTNTSGELLRTLPNPYGDGGKPFRVCDIEYVDGRLIAANGYADNVCFFADPFRTAAGDSKLGVWEVEHFGGKGTKHGRFGTAHGVTRVPDSDIVTIADRANSRLELYSKVGKFYGTLSLPVGCLPCDVDYYGRYAVVGCLKGPGGSTPAPIYILEDGNIVAELNIGKDLGLEGFTHIHNAAFRVIETNGKKQFFILAYAWNPGNFAVLEQVL